MKAFTVHMKDFLEEGIPGPKHFDIVESEVVEDDLQDGQVLVEVRFMSVDPYLRGRMKKKGPDDVGKNRVMEGFVSGVVKTSKNDKFKSGDFFGGNLPFQTTQIVKAERVPMMWKLSGLVDDKTLSRGVGVLGMPGSTAYAGVVGILRPDPKAKKVETMFISAASGAVGSIASQIAKNVFNCDVIGTAGGPEKCEMLTSKFCYDHAIDYKSIDTSKSDGGKQELVDRIKEVAPGGIDCSFENVGGFQFDAVFDSLAPGGRIAICGCISGYNQKNPPGNEIKLWNMIYTGQRIEGFVCSPWLFGQKGNFHEDMASWIEDGKIPAIEETFYDGIENWPVAFESLFKNTHRNVGKVVVRI